VVVEQEKSGSFEVISLSLPPPPHKTKSKILRKFILPKPASSHHHNNTANMTTTTTTTTTNPAFSPEQLQSLAVSDAFVEDFVGPAYDILLATADYAYPAVRACAIFDMFERSDREDQALMQAIKGPFLDRLSTVSLYSVTCTQADANRVALLCHFLQKRLFSKARLVLAKTDKFSALFYPHIAKALWLSGTSQELLPLINAKGTPETPFFIEYCKWCALVKDFREFIQLLDSATATAVGDRACQALLASMVGPDFELGFREILRRWPCTKSEKIPLFLEILGGSGPRILTEWLWDLDVADPADVQAHCEAFRDAIEDPEDSVTTVPLMIMMIAMHAWILPPKQRNKKLLDALVELALNHTEGCHVITPATIERCTRRADPRITDSWLGCGTAIPRFTCEHFAEAIRRTFSLRIRLMHYLCPPLHAYRDSSPGAMQRRQELFESILFAGADDVIWFIKELGLDTSPHVPILDARSIITKCPGSTVCELVQYIDTIRPGFFRQAFSRPDGSALLSEVAQKYSSALIVLMQPHFAGVFPDHVLYRVAIITLTFNNPLAAQCLVSLAKSPIQPEAHGAELKKFVSGGVLHPTLSVSLQTIRTFIALLPAAANPWLCTKLCQWFNECLEERGPAAQPPIEQCCALAKEYSIPATVFAPHGKETDVSRWMASRTGVSETFPLANA